MDVAGGFLKTVRPARIEIRAWQAWIACSTVLLLAAQPDAERQLQSAIHKEMVLGDLAGAVSEYRSFLAAENGKTRAMAARAMLHLAQCQEKLGDRNTAQRTYMRLARDYGDQTEIAAQARDKLFHWMEPLAGPRNLAFEKGETGKVPSGWFSHSAELTHTGCRSGACAVVQGSDDPADADAGAMRQTFSAVAYRGKTVRLRAWLRMESPDPLDRAQMWLRVERSNRQTGFFDNMADRPVRAASWTLYEISGDIDDDAQSVTFGVMVSGKARVWIDGVSFQATPGSDAETNRARAAIQKIYLAEGRAKFKSIRVSGGEAIVTARREDAANVYTLRETWNRSGDGWKRSESSITATRPIAPLTSAEETRAVAAELRDRAVPLGIVERGRTFYDLAPEGFAAFGKSVGGARVVALSDSIGVAHEVFELKRRLVEYLVKEKGFTTVAIERSGVDARAVDRYVKTGQGDPRVASEEILDLIRWMRAFHKSPGNHAVLTFGAGGDKAVIWTTGPRGGAYSVAFTVHRGEVRTEKGAQFSIPASAEGSGDSVLSAARVPLFFLDLRSVPEASALGRWIAAPHSFFGVEGGGEKDDPQRVEVLSRSYDGLIFVEEVHAAQAIQ